MIGFFQLKYAWRVRAGIISIQEYRIWFKQASHSSRAKGNTGIKRYKIKSFLKLCRIASRHITKTQLLTVDTGTAGVSISTGTSVKIPKVTKYSK